MKSNSTKLTVTKDVVERVRNLLKIEKIDLSITQFAEHILLEACDAVESTAAPSQLPTVTWIRQKSGKNNDVELLLRLEKIEKNLENVPATTAHTQDRYSPAMQESMRLNEEPPRSRKPTPKKVARE